MKINKDLKTSLAKQFSSLTITIIVMFSLLMTALLFYQNRITVEYESLNEKLQEKEKIATDVHYSFNLAISEMRAYYSTDGEESFYENVETQKRIVENKMAKLEEMADNEKDVLLLQEIRDFYQYYFYEVLPISKESYDAGKFEEYRKVTDTQNITGNIRAFQTSLKEYTDDLQEQLNSIDDIQIKKYFFSQVIFVGVLCILIASMVIFTRVKLGKMGDPLKKLTMAAGEIAVGQNVLFADTSNRDDELGLLSRAFEKMSRSIQDKEQNLNAQNEELIAQQDELQAQQGELEEALEMMQKRESELKRRNDLINGLTNSLDKKEVLMSIVKTMCQVIGGDQGIIALLDREGHHASFGVSKQGVKQFIDHLYSGSIEKLKETKKPYIIKRESHTEEKGFHTSVSYSYDLYLPVLNSTGNLDAVMLFSRFDQSFQDVEISEYEGLSKQIGISLDNMRLYEESEEERLLIQDILDTINEGIQLVDVKGEVILVNQKLRNMMNCHSTAFIGRSYENWIEDLVNSVENGWEFKQSFNDVLFENQRDQSTFIYHQHSPAHRVIRVYCEPLTRGGEKFGTVIVHRDITKEYEVDVMKSEFVSTVSHELRTPLASVLGFTELMLNKELNPERQKKYLSTIYQEANRLTALINSFLDVQRMESGKQTYDKKYDDIIPLIKSIIETYDVNYPNHAIHFDVKTTHTMVLGDKDKISQVFNNLISNAIKYSPEGGNIYVNVYEEGTNLKISIKDEGLGIPADALDQLFTKFYRIDNSDRRKIGGTGLGLAIVKGIMKGHNGDVSVQSVLKEGSIFTVIFPLVIGLNKSSQGDDFGSDQERKGKVNVIIVEDDSSLANLLKTELEESSLHVQVFREGEAALSAIKREHPDAIVLDITLEEGMNGWEIIKRLKEIDELKTIPIFISSALDEKEKGRALGANEYLIKPYQPSILSKLILQTLLKKDWSGQILIPSGHNE